MGWVHSGKSQQASQLSIDITRWAHASCTHSTNWCDAWLVSNKQITIQWHAESKQKESTNWHSNSADRRVSARRWFLQAITFPPVNWDVVFLWHQSCSSCWKSYWRGGKLHWHSCLFRSSIGSRKGSKVGPRSRWDISAKTKCTRVEYWLKIRGLGRGYGSNIPHGSCLCFWALEKQHVVWFWCCCTSYEGWLLYLPSMNITCWYGGSTLRLMDHPKPVTMQRHSWDMGLDKLYRKCWFRLRQ